LKIKFDNSYARDLAGMYVPWHVSGAPKPELVWLNEPLSNELGLSLEDLRSTQGLEMLSGIKEPEGAQAIAQAYAGHQFGHFSPQLGDGRALLLGEVLDRQEQRKDIAFKGSGRTPFSSGGDGKATLSSVLREVIISESMHALDIPTTRSLAAVATGETIMREHAAPAGILTRVASSHLRVGSFEFFAARGDSDSLHRLADYAFTRHVARHDSSLTKAPDRYLLLLQHVIDRQARLIAQWMGVGFIHGVMNTDNMTISGETIDYGPCAFMEAYNPQAVFSSIDTQGRYAYANQPSIAKWNLSRLASALLPLIDPELEQAKVLATDAVNTFDALFAKYSLAVWRAKLGLDSTRTDDESLDERLATDFLQLMQDSEVDFTLGWRSLVTVIHNNAASLQSLFGTSHAVADWLQRWQQRSATETIDSVSRLVSMKRANPIHIARNHLVEHALTEATERQDWQPFEALMTAITQPFEAGAIDSKFATPAPAELTACYRTFCGT
jgi:serine/tyrosine/threonine adenylyltransferase